MTELGRTTFFAALWGFVSAVGKRLLTLVSMMVLARVLAPEEFGIIGFAMIYFTFIEVIGDFGAEAALVYWPERRDDAAQVTFVVNAAAGLFWCVVSLALAPVLAHFLHEPRAKDVIRLLALAPAIKFLGNAHDALAVKALRFDLRAIPELALTGVKAIVAIALAWSGFGLWSLVWGHLAGTAAWTILLWLLVEWRPSLRFPRDLVGPMLRYGSVVVGVEVIATVMFYADALAIGHYLGGASLGLYQMASRIPEATMLVMIWVASSALFPAFTRLHAEGRDVRPAYLTATRCLASLTMPAAVGLFFLSRPIMTVFFGARWAPAAPILSIIAIYVGLRGVDEVGNVLKSTGRTKLLIWLTVAKAAAMIPAVIFAARFSAVAVAIALAAVYGLATIVTTVIASRVIALPLRSMGAAFLPATEAAAVLAAVLFFWMRLTPPGSDLLKLAGGVAGGGLTYLLALRVADPTIFDWLLDTVLRRSHPIAS